MKVLQQILDKAGLAPISRFKIQSNSELGKFHIVKVFRDGHLECDCNAGRHNQPCRHIRHTKIVKSYLTKLNIKCHQTQNKKNSTEKEA